METPETAERNMINIMAMGILAITAAAVLFLAIRTWSARRRSTIGQSQGVASQPTPEPSAIA